MKKVLCVVVGVIVACSATTALGTWEAGPSLLTARDQFAGGVLDGKLIVFGGNGNPGGVNLESTELLDPSTSNWVYKADNNHNGGWGVEEVSGAVINGKFYVFGAYSWPSGPFNFVEEYNPTNDTWTSKAPMPTTRTTATAVAYNNKIYLFGGDYYISEQIFTNYTVVEVYDPANDTWSTETYMPINVRSPYIAVVGDKAYVIGGLLGSFSDGHLVTDVSVYDFVTHSWSTNGYTPMPNPSAFGYASAAPTKNGNIYLVGGCVASGTNFCYSTKVDIYDTVSNTWQSGYPLPIPTGSGFCAIVSNDLWVVGGNNGELDGDEEDIVVATVWKHSLTNIALPPLRAALSPTTDGFEISWSAVEGLAYSVLWTPNLTNSFQTLQSGIEPPQNSYTDIVNVAESAGFYRVELE